jgi:hypothetical protein
MEKGTNPQDLTPEQLQELRDVQITFMTEQLPALKIQEEYTRLKANIAENVFNEHFNKVKLAQLKSPPQKGSDTDIDKTEE